MIKRRIGALLLCLSLACSLAACTGNAPSELNGRETEYSGTVAYAASALGGVDITESATGHSLTNKTARLEFGHEKEGLVGMTSLQTGETLLKNTFVTLPVSKDGRVAAVTAGTEQVEQGQYGIGHRRVDGALRLPAKPEEATALKIYDLTEDDDLFAALANDVTAEGGESGLTVTSGGKNRSQFGARYLDLDLEKHDRYYLSVTLKSQGISGLRCYFSTDSTPLTEETVLGTLMLSDTEETVTLTAEIGNPLWNGILQTLLFRFPEGETGTLTLTRVAILTADDKVQQAVADTLWTVYSDRIYFSQVLNLDRAAFGSVSTEIRINGAQCHAVTETEHAVALRMIDGSLLGFVRPSEGATLRVEKTEAEVRLILDWDLSAETLMLVLPVYLNYTASDAELQTFAKNERIPLTADSFQLEGATFDRYDRRGGMYRLTRTAEEVSVTLKSNDRTVYVHLLAPENTAWKLCDRDSVRLPVFAGATFPLRCEGRDLTVRLKPEKAPEDTVFPSFFPESGLRLRSETSTVLNGLCAQQTAVFVASDGSYTVTLTATKLNGGRCTVYDIRYDFLGRKQVSDLLTAFPFFSFELTYGFESYSYLNGENETVTVPAGSTPTAYLGSMPFIRLEGDTESAGWIVTKSSFTAGGKTSTALQALHYEEVTEDSPNRLYLAFDGGEASFVRGDTLTAQVIRVDGTEGTDRLAELRKNGNLQLIQTGHRSEGPFTALGMEDSVILQIEGFDDYRFPEMTANGEPFSPEYHVYVDDKGYYGFAFSVKTGSVIAME